jgi:hypothetical protein
MSTGVTGLPLREAVLDVVVVAVSGVAGVLRQPYHSAIRLVRLNSLKSASESKRLEKRKGCAWRTEYRFLRFLLHFYVSE